MKSIYLALIIIISISAFYSFTPDSKITKQQLGEKLFFDKILSEDETKSCSSCHIPEFGFADTTTFSIGVHGRLGKRNAPTCTNLSGRTLLFYDGRADSLEHQVKFPIEDSNEMNLPIAEAVNRLNKSQLYTKLFHEVYHQPPTEANLKSAIAAYERTLETSNTPFDKYMQGDSTAISLSAQRGREIFMGTKAKCFDCHFSPDFTGDEFKNIGLYDGKKYNDAGRYGITKKTNDLGKFKVPSLRNVAVTAPYMHNGMFKTLQEVVNYYNEPLKVIANPINVDTLLQQPLKLTDEEKTDLVNFLQTLTDKRFIKK